MAVRGPELRAKYTLDISQAHRNIVKIASEIESYSRKQVGASGKVKKAHQEEIKDITVHTTKTFLKGPLLTTAS